MVSGWIPKEARVSYQDQGLGDKTAGRTRRFWAIGGLSSRHGVMKGTIQEATGVHQSTRLGGNVGSTTVPVASIGEDKHTAENIRHG